jgi:polyisoprenoid-binding protein YceI
MRRLTVFLVCALAATLQTLPRASAAPAAAAGAPHTPLAITSARVTLDGTSNIHPFTASSSTIRVIAMDVAGAPSADVLDTVLQPGALTAFEVTVPTTSLSSPRDGVDKNMHKALKAQEFPELRFKLGSLTGADATGAYRAAGRLTIAGVEKDVTLTVQTERTASGLGVTATTELLMTDYGITPPKALMGMLKTDPKVRIRIDLALTAPAST